jgi:hypothetical protein
VQTVPRPPPSVPLGGSLRASRAAQLALPAGPLAAIDLADGRALVAELRDGVWVELSAEEATLVLPRPLPELSPVPPRPPPARRRRAGVVLALAAALGAAVVGLVTGFSGTPAPAVAGAIAQPVARRPPTPRWPAPGARGGRAVALPPRRLAIARRRVVPALTPPPAARPAAPTRERASPPAPPPPPVLPAAPAL